MKKLLSIAILFAATAFTATAQNNTPPPVRAHDNGVRIGVKGGYNSANLTNTNDGNVRDQSAISSFHIGLYTDLPLLPILSVQPGVFLTGKGAKYTVGDNNSNNYTEVSTRPLYVEVPVNVVMKIPLPNKVKLFAGAGPYGAVGVGGQNKVEGKVLGLAFDRDEEVNFSNDDPQTGSNGSAFSGSTKRFDAGVNVLAGIEISHFTLNANYGIGLVNTVPTSSNYDTKFQNRVLSLSVGVLF